MKPPIKAEKEAVMKPLDLRVYLVTRPFLPEEGGFAELCRRVELALETGVVGTLQFRDKRASQKEFTAQAVTLLQICRQYRARLIVNDRVEVAQSVGADGVHLGQGDMPAHAARRWLGPQAIIGVSVRESWEAREVALSGVTYLGANGVFPSRTKNDFGAPLGLDGIKRLRGFAGSLPLVAIGGITPENATQVALAGADGAAMVSAILDAEDIAAACCNLRAKVLAGLALRAPPAPAQSCR